MPLHDWTRVDAGIFHHFHLTWIAELARVLNGGLLPEDCYALGEQVTGGGTPDVLALHEIDPGSAAPSGGRGGTAVLAPPRAASRTAPRTAVVAQAEQEAYTRLQRRMVIRHTSGDRVIAVIGIVSAGNKASEYAWQSVMNKSLAALGRGVHLLALDAYPPTPRDPGGFHGSLWGQLTGEEYATPEGADRTLAAYLAGPVKTAYVEPVAVGRVLRDMPLFLAPDEFSYVDVPLEATYQAAYAGVPRRYRAALEAAG